MDKAYLSGRERVPRGDNEEKYCPVTLRMTSLIRTSAKSTAMAVSSEPLSLCTIRKARLRESKEADMINIPFD